MGVKQINGEMLLLARKRRRKTQTELAAASGVAQAAISRIENGTRDTLPMEELRAVAGVLGFPVSFFFEQDPRYRKPLSLHGAAFRKRASVSTKDQDAVVSLANHFVLHFQKLLDAVEVEPQFPLLQFEVVESRSAVSEHAAAVASPAEAASKVRAAWQTGDGPLHDLTRYVEATGVLVVSGDFGGADIDGLTLRPAGMRPIIILNRDRPADRRRFSLAHEYGHVVLHPYPYEAMEKEANEFAAEILMPKGGILPDLSRRLSLPYLGQLKKKWRVAISALIYRAKTVGAISADAAVSLYKQMNTYGYRIREPKEFDIEDETGRLARQLVDAHLNELGYSLEELAIALRTESTEFAEMHGLVNCTPKSTTKPKLRLIVNE